MKIFKYIGIIVLSLCSFSAIAQVPAPGEAQKEPIAIMNAYAHLGNGKLLKTQ